MPLVRVASLSDLCVPDDYARSEQHHAATEILPPPPRKRASKSHGWPLGVNESTDQAALRRERQHAAEQARLRGEAAAEAQENSVDPWSLATQRVLTRELPALRGAGFQVTRRAASAGVSITGVATSASLRLQVPRDHARNGMRTGTGALQPPPRGAGVPVSGDVARASDGSVRCVAARESFSHRLGLCNAVWNFRQDTRATACCLGLLASKAVAFRGARGFGAHSSPLCPRDAAFAAASLGHTFHY